MEKSKKSIELFNKALHSNKMAISKGYNGATLNGYTKPSKSLVRDLKALINEYRAIELTFTIYSSEQTIQAKTKQVETLLSNVKATLENYLQTTL